MNIRDIRPFYSLCTLLALLIYKTEKGHDGIFADYDLRVLNTLSK